MSDSPRRDRKADEPEPARSAAERGELAPLGGAGDDPVDLSRTVTDMRRLLEQLEEAARSPSKDANSQQPLAVMARMLQYVHDSHAQIVKTLENQDRSELFLQSTQALNQTFRRLNQSQDALVDKLLAERRRNPWYLVAGASLVAIVVVVAVFLLIDYRNGGLRDEVDRMATARDGLTAVVADSQRSFHEMGTKLAETVDKTLAANRVLDNENRAKAKEMESMRAELSSAIQRRDDLEREKSGRDERLTDLERERGFLENKITTLQTKLLDKELAAKSIDDLIDQRLGKRGDAKPKPADAKSERPIGESLPEAPVSGVAPDPAAAASSENALDATDATNDRGVDAASEATEPVLPTDTVPTDTEPNDAEPTAPYDADPLFPDPGPIDEAARDAEIAGNARIDMVTNAVNQFLVASGVIDHRLLRHSGTKDGELREIMLEIRDDLGAPVGFHSAAGMKIVVDPGKLTARLILREGETVVRGARTPFSEGIHAVDVAAVAPDSFTAVELMPFLVLDAPMPQNGEAAVVPARKERFDPREPLALLNARLASSGRGHVRFARLGGIDLGRLADVELNHYSGSGALQKVVAAKSCVIEIDAAARRVSLVFRGGKHTQNGRETPFFAGRGEDPVNAAWRLDLDDADVEGWSVLKETLATERFVD